MGLGLTAPPPRTTARFGGLFYWEHMTEMTTVSLAVLSGFGIGYALMALLNG